MPTDRVFLTGATGFVGSHILRELVEAGYRVRALTRTPQRDDGVEYVTGDLERVGAFARAMDGCRFAIHCAALYSFSPRERARTRTVNVIGTAGIVEAARVAGIERVVLTSSSATLGPSVDGVPRTEEDYACEGPARGYHHSKLEQERAAFAGRVPLVALLPTAPVGPGDGKPTPTGKLILEFARGKIVALPPRGGLNVVPVEDVARAHVRALTHGRAGERYILGAENVTLDRLWEMLSTVTGKPLPRMRVPDPLLYAIAYADEIRCRTFAGAQPEVPMEGVRLSHEFMYADGAKASRELDFSPGSAQAALERAVRWYRDRGYAS